jgi:hypothetical protein
LPERLLCATGSHVVFGARLKGERGTQGF